MSWLAAELQCGREHTDLSSNRCQSFSSVVCRPVMAVLLRWRPEPLFPTHAPMVVSKAPSSLSFGPGGRYELQPAERRLLVDGEPVALGARAFDLLLALSAMPGALLTKQQLLDAVWPNLVVEEHNLATQISSLRKVLGGDTIATIPGRGYRFTAPISSDAPRRSSSLAAPTLHANRESGLAALRTNLPYHLPTLLGRDSDLATLSTLIERRALVSIVGPGGIGKSLLAQHCLTGLSTRYHHGVCWIELAAVADRAALPATVAAALGIHLGAGAPLAALQAAIAPLEVLVALDNAEHVLGSVAELIHAMLQGAPRLRILVTSQAPLNLPNESVYRIGSLALPGASARATEALTFSAVALFVERAQMADAHFGLTDANAAAVAEVCRALDGLPLAIELAAARASVLGVHRLASSMQDRLKLLTVSRDRVAPARQQTLRAALEWSHSLLDDRERTVFRRLAVFAGSGSLTVVQQVVTDRPDEGALEQWAVLDALSVLVDRSLVMVLVRDAGNEPSYRLAESTRLFALERLVEAGEEDILRARHAREVANRFDAAYERRFDGSSTVSAWTEHMTPELGNARAAIDWASVRGEKLTVLRIIPALIRALPRSAVAESLSLTETAELLVTEEVPVRVRARTWLACNSVAAIARPSREVTFAARAVQASRVLRSVEGDDRTLYRALCASASALGRAGSDSLWAALDEAHALERSDWPPTLLLNGAVAEAVAASRVSPQAHVDALRRVRGLAEACGADTLHIDSNLLDAELQAGNPTVAVRMGLELLARAGNSRLEYEVTLIRLNTMAALLALDDCAQARVVGRPGWDQAARFHVQDGFADHLALLAALEDRVHASALLAGYSDVCWAALGVERTPNEAAALQRATSIACASMGNTEFDRLRANGRALRDEQIAAIAFSLTE